MSVTVRQKIKENFDNEIQRLIEGIKNYNPEKIILYGSWARGDYHEGSDVDLVIIKETNERFMDRIGKILDLNNSNLAIEPLVYTPSEFDKMKKEGNPFIEQVAKEGKVIYG